MTLAKPGNIGIDISGFRLDTKEKVNRAKKANCRFVFRYSAGKGNSYAAVQWKLCGHKEIENILKDGFDFIANSEWYADRITEGASAGDQDGRADLQFWKDRGLAKGSVILVSWDTHPNPNLFDEVEDYLAAYDEALGGYYCVGLYGGSAAIREMKKRGVITCGWQSMSTSWSDNDLPYQPSQEEIDRFIKNPPKGIDIWQTGNYWFGNDADEDVLFTNDVLSHNRALQDKPVHHKPKPHKKHHHKKSKPSGGHYIVRPSDSDGLIAVCHRHDISDWREVARLNDIEGPAFVIRPGDVIRWPGGSNKDRKPEKPKKITYEVEVGDTLTSIARKWGVSLRALEKANPHLGHPEGHYNNIWPHDIVRHP